jgi:hypothetical protein
VRIPTWNPEPLCFKMWLPENGDDK